MKEIIIRKKDIGKNRPSICVPLTANNRESLFNHLKKTIVYQPDLIEIRLDLWDDLLMKAMTSMLQNIRKEVGEIPIIATYRTKKEGGQGLYQRKKLYTLYSSLIKDPSVDVIDIEIFQGKEKMIDFSKQAKDHDKKIILSYHNFEETPCEDKIMNILSQGVILGGDIVKVAVMPQTSDDILRLLGVANKAHRELDIPIIALSMGLSGKITRIFGGLFGSIITFSSLASFSSAPGQIDIEKMKEYIKDNY